MNPALHELLQNPSAEAVDAFIAAHEFPLVDRSGATFCYRGEAEMVNLQHWIFGLASSQSFTRVNDTDLWYLHLELPENSRVEYKIEVVNNGHGQWLTDPLNPQHAHDPFGSNSVCQGYGYERPEWTWPDEDARAGTLEDLHIHSRALRAEQNFKVYVPARFRRSRRYPLLIVHDGRDFLHYAQLKTVLDNLIDRLEIAPMIVALTQSSDRLKEYAGDPAHATFLSEEVLPLLNTRFPLLDDPAARGLMGASFGGVASLYTAWRYPGLFGCLLLQSGSFAFTDIGHHRRGPVFDPVVKFINAFRENPGRPAQRLFVSCGTYESLIYENRSMVPLLQEHGMEVRYVEARDGHNWENWRDRLRDGLSWLFPGPLWMVYE